MTITIQKATTIRNGRERRDGWDLFINGEWHDRLPTKRAAQAAARAEITERDALMGVSRSVAAIKKLIATGA